MVIGKSYVKKCERAAEHYAIYNLNCIITDRERGSSSFQRRDFLGCLDVIGKRASGVWVCIQATIGSMAKVRERQKKIEKIAWHSTDIVQILQLRFEQKGRSKSWYFNVFDYSQFSRRKWLTHIVEVPQQWFLAYKREA